MTTVTLIDNYNSFTFNLVHYLGALGAQVKVLRNDQASVAEIVGENPDCIVLSPGPCTPHEAGVCLDLIRAASAKIPIFGVCLGHQAIGEAFGGDVVRAPLPIHGKIHDMFHQGETVFHGLPTPFKATRYHSLVVRRDSLPTELAVTAETADGLVMGLSHLTRPVHGVQFHPESIASEHGHALLRNFLDLAKSWNAAKRPNKREPSAVDAFKPFLAKIASGARLSREEAEAAFHLLLSGQSTPAQTGAFLMGLRARGESLDEMTGAVSAMRAKMLKVQAPEGAIDIVGTGGDGAQTFNISTLAAIIVAACGVPVAKHGNRAASSLSGASDVLSELGVRIGIAPDIIERSLSEAQIGFMTAQAHHAAMAHVAPVRRELGSRTLFNLLGPLSNPAGVRRALIGVFAESWMEPIAETLKTLGAEVVWVVHGSDGLDEITTTGPTKVLALEHGALRRFEIAPEDVGVRRATLAELRGGDPAHNAAALRAVLAGEKNAYRDIAALNAAAALVVAGKAADLKTGFRLAEEALDSGRARDTLENLIRLSNQSEGLATQAEK